MRSKLENWRTCTKCGLAKHRRFVVIGRGVWPADLFLLGIAPGKSENLLATPFIGEAGALLQATIEKALVIANAEVEANERIARGLTYYISNMVACRPCNSKYGPNRDPLPPEITACYPRVVETYRMVRPRMVITFGKLTASHYGKIWPNTLTMEHPASLTRKGGLAAPNYGAYVRQMAEAFGRMLLKH